MKKHLTEYYRCPERYIHLALNEPLSEANGYFRFGKEIICYGRGGGIPLASTPSEPLHDAYADTKISNGAVTLPFDPDQVVDSLRYERYTEVSGTASSPLQGGANRLYYFIRPLLSVAVRKHLQRIRLKDWDKVSFPHWPVDRTVDIVLERLLLLSLRAKGVERIPFIWFWPGKAASCAILTHDVETTMGRDFCSTMMDIDDSFAIKSSFQVVPEVRYDVPAKYLDSIRDRGFEVGVQDLNHDGRLYLNREQFAKRTAKINAYGRQWKASGFRAGILYRRQEWFDQLDFEYEMSVPNVAHLDPQRGGCCTVMPYFVGNLLEMPVTTIQDYTLFHILKDYSMERWNDQIELIMEKHGLMNFIIHPDYVTTDREQQMYKKLLARLAQLRDEQGVWIPTPYEVNRWWRQRAQMTIVEDGNTLRIVGAGNERARIAYASEKEGQLIFTFA
jgi:hypothetical protein